MALCYLVHMDMKNLKQGLTQGSVITHGTVFETMISLIPYWSSLLLVERRRLLSNREALSIGELASTSTTQWAKKNPE